MPTHRHAICVPTFNVTQFAECERDHAILRTVDLPNRIIERLTYFGCSVSIQIKNVLSMHSVAGTSMKMFKLKVGE